MQKQQSILEVPKSFSENVRKSIDEEVLRESSNTARGAAFLRWVATRLFDLSEEEIENQTTDGTHDEGIDAWSITETEGDKEGIVQLFQYKYGQSYDIEKEVAGFQRDVKNFLNKAPWDVKREKLQELLKIIKENKYEHELYFITDQKIKFRNKPKLKVFGIDQIINRLWEDIAGKPLGKKETLTLEKKMEYNKTIIGVVSLSELVNFVNNTESYIFESNIRKYLRKTKVNKGLIETLKDRSQDVFYFNNGITIVVKNFEVNGNEIKLDEPQIVNGAQNSSIIAQYITPNHPTKGNIQVTIIKEDNKTSRKEITRFRNSQNAVQGKDLISLEDFHTRIHSQLKLRRYYYEHQAGGWFSLTLEEKKYYTLGDIDYNKYLPDKHNHVISATESIQAMVAGIFQELTKAYSSKANYLPSGKYYAKVFSNELKEDFRLLFYPYLIKCYGKEKFGFGEKDPDRPYRQYARLLFVTAYFKILVEYVMNKKFEDILDDPQLLEPYFKNFEANTKLLEFTNMILENYFANALKYYADNKISTWHNFYSHSAWIKSLRDVFDGYVIYHKNDLKEIKKEIKK